jgi:hypothetical protein
VVAGISRSARVCRRCSITSLNLHTNHILLQTCPRAPASALSFTNSHLHHVSRPQRHALKNTPSVFFTLTSARDWPREPPLVWLGPHDFIPDPRYRSLPAVAFTPCSYSSNDPRRERSHAFLDLRRRLKDLRLRPGLRARSNRSSLASCQRWQSLDYSVPNAKRSGRHLRPAKRRPGEQWGRRKWEWEHAWPPHHG